MSLIFLEPIWFLGLAAVAVPILIHLMERRREIVLTIPTVRFIAEAHRRTSRRLKIRRWLLLALRILMVALLSAILARPALVSRESLVSAARPSSTVIILDNSPSMGYQDGGVSRWEKARRAARSFAARAAAAGEAAVMAAAGGAAPRGFSRDAGALAARVEELAPAPVTADPVAALNAAYRLMSGASFADRQIVLLTDLTRAEWQRFDPRALERPDLGVPVRLVDVSGGREGWNRAVLRVEAVPAAGAESVGRARVGLAFFGDAPGGPVTLRLDLDGRMISRRMVEPGGGDRVVEFPLPRMESGTHTLRATLDADPLAFDDEAWGSIEFGGRVRVLTVDGSPRGSLMDSETYFLMAALVPDRLAEDRKVESALLLPGQLRPESLEGVQVAVLANVRSLERDMAVYLSQWVARGGGLIIFLGDNYDEATYRESFDGGGADLLPAFLGRARSGAPPTAVDFVEHASYPLSIFASPGSGDFSRATFTGWVTLGPGGLKPGAAALLALDRAGGEPVLVERPMGQGRVLLMLSTADLDWNNLATQAVYLPLVQRCVEYLSGPRGLRPGGQATAGGAVAAELPADFPGTSVPVVTPDGRRLEAAVERREGSVRGVLARGEVPGTYTFHAGGREIAAAVNLTRDESDTRRAAPEAMAAASSVLPLETVKLAAEDLSEETLRGTEDPTPWLFALLLLLLLVEGSVSLRTSFRRRPAPAASPAGLR